MILKVPKVEQLDDECGPASVAQVLEFFGVGYSMQEIVDFTSNSYKYKDWDYLMGQYLINKGFDITIVTFQSTILDPSWENLSKEKLLSKLKEELSFFYSDSPRLKHSGFLAWHKSLGADISETEEAIKFLETGGVIRIKPLRVLDIIEELKIGNPVIVAYDSVLLHGIKRGFMGKADDIAGHSMGHVSVVAGFTKDKFLIVDPSYWYRKEETYYVDQCRLINSIILRNSQYIICEYKNDRSRKNF